MVRPAFTMIELIFALVIMGIVFVSLPLILLRNANALEENLIQESIFLASAKMSHITSFQWDHNSSETGINTLATTDAIDVSAAGGAAALNRTGITDFRVGHFTQDKHRRMSPQDVNFARSATPIGPESAVFDDIDDFHTATGAEVAMVNSAAGDVTTEEGYKKLYRTDINITYVDDDNGGAFFNGNTAQSFVFPIATSAQTTNLKMIDVSIDQNDSTGWTTTLRLRAYAANIGETDYFKRRY